MTAGVLDVARPRAAVARRRRPVNRTAWVFVAPATLGFLVFILLPLLLTIVYSFTEYDLFDSPRFVGLENYTAMLSDSRLAHVYLNTAVFTLLATPLNVGLALVLAVGLHQVLNRFVSAFARAAFFFPSLVGLVFVAIIWQFFFQTDFGIINYYLGLVGVDPVPWLSSPEWAIPSVVILDVWKNVGLATIILLAGLQGIPAVYYQAAAIDGAGGWRRFRSITVPLLSPQLFFVLTLYLIGAVKVFESIVVLTDGGPGDASRSVVMYIYEKAFKSFDFGYASAVSVTLLVIVSLVTLVQFRVSRRWVHYE
ncbi:carbohydrate ABC transporter permease [Rathayibacter sp. VKM Ac-2630]|uniref:carbohydrate ABC transporter permease n=1 Tax=Rathayibacter sp. VKM Ac-2630 TaxID=1938617 RepID=UPI000981BC02|nr:sugar ABC transporter permease [Rathayibacter sp. VKM Ac-2630]OOB91421.1 hypothetical protein B0T42_06065 [Rathayibacter sp. VKM Ac-2630]